MQNQTPKAVQEPRKPRPPRPPPPRFSSTKPRRPAPPPPRRPAPPPPPPPPPPSRPPPIKSASNQQRSSAKQKDPLPDITISSEPPHKSDNKRNEKPRPDVGRIRNMEDRRRPKKRDKPSPEHISISPRSTKMLNKYKRLDKKLLKVAHSTDKKLKMVSEETNEKLKKAKLIGVNCHWLLLFISRIVLFFVEMSCVAFLASTDSSVFLSHLPLYSRKPKMTIASVVVCSCFTNLMNVFVAFFCTNTTIWSSHVPIQYSIWISCQIVGLSVVFSVLGVALKNLNEAIKPQDMLPLLKERHDLHYFIDHLQNQRSCCGINGPGDWKRLNLSIPRSCCNNNNCSSSRMSVHLHNYGCYDYVMDDAEKELQLLLSLTGGILFLQIPAFFVTWLSFPDLGILQRFFKVQNTLDSELLVKLQHIEPSLNIQNSNIKTDEHHRRLMIQTNSRSIDESDEIFGNLQKVPVLRRERGGLPGESTSYDRLGTEESHLRMWLWDNRFIPRFRDVSNFEDYVKSRNEKDIASRKSIISRSRANL